MQSSLFSCHPESAIVSHSSPLVNGDPCLRVTEYRIRAPIISFNSLCLIAGFAMLGFADQVTVRYVGCYLATGAYVSNWAALNSYQANNITGQWKRAVTAVHAFFSGYEIWRLD